MSAHGTSRSPYAFVSLERQDSGFLGALGVLAVHSLESETSVPVPVLPARRGRWMQPFAVTEASAIQAAAWQPRCDQSLGTGTFTFTFTFGTPLTQAVQREQ
jgi:hypothetical protein